MKNGKLVQLCFFKNCTKLSKISRYCSAVFYRLQNCSGMKIIMFTMYVAQCVYLDYNVYIGHLVLWSVKSALLSTTNGVGSPQRRTVYESLFVEHENYRGRTREHVCLRLSPRSVTF